MPSNRSYLQRDCREIQRIQLRRYYFNLSAFHMKLLLSLQTFTKSQKVTQKTIQQSFAIVLGIVFLIFLQSGKPSSLEQPLDKVVLFCFASLF